MATNSGRDPDDYYDLGGFHRSVTTRSPVAQRWFDYGLIWSYAFNHEEASECFERAIAADPDCAMAHWGLAYTLGPNYNKPWSLFGAIEGRTTAVRIREAVETASKHAAEASNVERALAKALVHRYPQARAPGDEKEGSIWNKEYAEAMSSVFAEFPNDLDVAVLYADAMMNLTPWELWDLQTGEPAPGAHTIEIKRVLEHAMSLKGGFDHAGILHLYIHLMEMSATPETAKPAADRLRNLIPDAGHLNHMPSHIDILIGDYAKGVEANVNAIRADEKFDAREGGMNFYTLYRCHDIHFCLYSAMFSGQSKIALESAAKLERTITRELLMIESPPMANWLEAFYAMRVHVLIRFGLWDEAMALELPKDQELYCMTTAVTYYARAIALAATGKVEEATQQRDAFRSATARVKPSRLLFNNRCSDVLAIASAMLDGEIAYRSADYAAAFTHLRDAIDKYDNLPFDEPWGWMQPVRHAYGALLLEQGHVEDALAVYRADLGYDETLPRAHRHLNNVWSLHGYHECLVRLGREEEAEEVGPKLRAAMVAADVKIGSSCFCRTRVAKI